MHTKVAQGSGRSTSRGIAILNTSHLQQLLGDRGGHNPGTSGGRDEPHPDGTALAGDLARNGMGFTDLVTPETSPDGHDGKLSQNDGATDGSGDLFGALDAETDMAVVVTDGDKGLETGTLTSTGLFLDGHDFKNLVLERWSQKEINDFEFLKRFGSVTRRSLEFQNEAV